MVVVMVMSATAMAVVVMVVMMVFMLFIFMVVMMMVLMLLLIIVIIIILLIAVMILNLVDPCCRCSHLVEVETTGVEQTLQVYVAVVARYDFCFRLNGADYLGEFAQIFSAHLRRLVEKYRVAELNLLYYEVFEVFVFESVACQSVAVVELVSHAQRVHHGHDAVKTRYAVGDILRTECHHRTDSLRNRCGFADATRLDDDIVEALHVDDVAQLVYKVHLQRAADAAVLQSHQTVVLLVHHSTLLDEVGVDVHLADIVHDNGELNAFLIRKDSI